MKQTISIGTIFTNIILEAGRFLHYHVQGLHEQVSPFWWIT